MKKADFNALNEAAIKVSDGVVLGSPDVSAELKTVIRKAGVPCLEYYPEESFVKPIDEFYDQIIEELVV